MNTRSVVRGVVVFFLLALLFPVGFIGWSMISEFRPDRVTIPEMSGRGNANIKVAREFTIMSWNIGYAGLGEEMDFFYDGGTRVRDAREQVQHNLNGITVLTGRADSVDFFFIQEADRYAKRSWYMDNYGAISQSLPGFAGFYAKNYDCRYVPMPIREPMGRVVSGIACFTKFNPTSGESVYFDITFPWPKRLFFLKRCFIALRYELGLGRDLVMINTHNSAFDSTGALRQRELEILADYMRTEYQRGNYVIAGGDWNSNPRGFNPGAVSSGDSAVAVEPPMPSSFLPGWQFAFDSAVPSNRFLDEAYQRGRTRTTIIDFFVVSPNVEVEHVRTISDGFRYSDHHPVIMKFKLTGAIETP